MFDTHAHITDKRYEDYTKIITDMQADGLDGLVTVGYDTESSRFASEIALAHKNVYASVGMHPTEEINEECLEEIYKLARKSGVVAYGEIGLDYFHAKENAESQKYWLGRQLDLARELELPVIIHSRDCDRDMFDILSKWAKSLTAPLIMHCFSSSAELAREYVKLGFYISFAGPVTYKNANRGEAVCAVPDNRLLIETDCPYLTPVPHRGKLNYPAYVRYVAEKLAEFKGMSFDDIDRITTENAKRVYGIC